MDISDEYIFKNRTASRRTFVTYPTRGRRKTNGDGEAGTVSRTVHKMVCAWQVSLVDIETPVSSRPDILRMQDVNK